MIIFLQLLISTNDNIFAIMWLLQIVIFLKLCDFFKLVAFLFLHLCDFYKLVAFCCFVDSSEESRPRLDPMAWILKDELFIFNLFCCVLYILFFFPICFVLYIFFLPRWAPTLALIAIVPFPFWLKDIFAFLPTRFRLNFVLFQKWSQWATPSLYNLFFSALVFFFRIYFVILFFLPTRFP